MRRTTALMMLVVGIAACESKEDSKTAETAEKTEAVEKAVEGLKDEAETAVATASDGDCDTYLNRVREVCLASLNDGLNVACHTAGLIPANIALKQLSGELFDTKGNDRAAGNAVCASSLKRLEKKVKGAKTEGTRAETAECKGIVKLIDDACFVPLTKKETPPQGCNTVVLVAKLQIKQGECMPELIEAQLSR